ncbi:hypothetical protein SMD20_39550 [Nonomuraea sp. LP-02]|uniref:hypothetical protein n=1 Tax=Nonomuraea sp. LP-02 TaxID=3097960 RepID=UPI002E36780E|nr:hypothetical protein [Nonomuraea sp. LP-02]MED7930379.1 hypothetical protein [Nonomuraea sp. LP-02]
MDDHYQPGYARPNGEQGGTTFASGPSAGPAEDARSFDELTAEKIAAARHAYYAAAAEVVIALQNGRWLSSEQLFAAAHSRATRAWWDLAEQEISGKKLTSDHAVRRVRSWARHYLTGEPPVARPGTLFDHAIAHASRIAARDFLTASGQLLTQHLAEPSDGAGVPASGVPLPNRHATGSTPNPVAVPSAPSTRAAAP